MASCIKWFVFICKTMGYLISNDYNGYIFFSSSKILEYFKSSLHSWPSKIFNMVLAYALPSWVAPMIELWLSGSWNSSNTHKS